jgi:hypothetical protein
MAAASLLSPLTACSSLGDRPAPGGSSGGLAGFYDQKLAWVGCGGFAVSAQDKQSFTDPVYDCTYLRVPLDYGHPDAGEAQIAVL